MKEYDHKEIEARWRKKWQADNLYKVEDGVSGKENFYTLVEFPYPSGNLHIGHWYAFAVPDIFARFKRMSGYNVLFPIGFDAFGLPAENAAIKRNLDPRVWTSDNIKYMTGQLESMGNMFDWSRQVITADPQYYQWTQWLFLKLFEKGLAYKKEARVNWCDSCQTVLANEQVVDGKCERCGMMVSQKMLAQWFFKTTDYAERLLTDLENLDWPEAIKESQRNWIGKSEGALISFRLKAKSLKLSNIEVFTTRADTLFGATYLVVAPEVANEKFKSQNEKLQFKIENWSEIEEYLNKTKNKTEIERMAANKEKTGVEIKGIKAVNPATGEEIPIWVADYVLGNYGTGAVMAVPAHDERDFEFAKKFELPVKPVVIPRLVDESNPHVPNKEMVFRNAVIAVVRNPQTDKYLCLKWKKQPWTTFVMGGMEDNEDSVAAARREILEETGYKNVRFIKRLNLAQSEFFAAHKDVNRIAHTRSLLFELIDEDKEEVSEEEKEIHEVFWLSLDEIRQTDMTHIEIPLILENIDSSGRPYIDEGIMFDSGEFTKLTSQDARKKIANKFGRAKTTYKLRDWLVSRQRYWGCPIPIVYDPKGKPIPVSEDKLPWLLPQDVDFKPTGQSPLATSKEFKERTEKIFGAGFTPEYDTMDTFVDSSWYFSRYTDPHNNKEFARKEKLKSWLPVKRYSGGAEHTTMHLLYARFFHKALFDLGLVNETEPFAKRLNRGLILGPDGQKMSKSKGNVIDPDEWVVKVGADTVRIYLAFIGPYNEVGQYPWDLGGIAGVRRFLERIWKQQEKINDNESDGETLKFLHQTIKKVGEDIEQYKFNTAISALMKLVNHLERLSEINKEVYLILLKIISPFAPHLAEELWTNLGHKTSIHLETWPTWDKDLITEDKLTIVVQINGKVRGDFEAEISINEEEAKNQAQTLPKIKQWLAEGEIEKIIYVPKKLVNIVIK